MEDFQFQSGPEGVTLSLAGKALRTPKRNLLLAPDEETAALLAKEWLIKRVKPTSETPLLRVVCLAIDADSSTLETLRETAFKYFMSDVMCYRATWPQELVSRQSDVWDPVLTSLHEMLRASFLVTSDIRFVTQPKKAIQAAENAIRILPSLEQVCFQALTMIGHSALIALATGSGLLPAEEAFDACYLDEDWQSEKWGGDPEKRDARKRSHQDYLAIARLWERVRNANRASSSA